MLKLSEGSDYVFSGTAIYVLGGLLIAGAVWAANQTFTSSAHTKDIADIKATLGIAVEVQNKQQNVLSRMDEKLDWLTGVRRGLPPAASSSNGPPSSP